MVGAVPCKLSSELHINGQRVFRAKDKSIEREVVVANAGRSTNRNQVVSAEGREVVCPGYSMPTYTFERRGPQHVIPPHGAWPGNRGARREILNLARYGVEINPAQPGEEVNPMQPGNANPAQPGEKANPA
jgi:hypothetical protein